MKSLILCTPPHYCAGDKIEKCNGRGMWHISRKGELCIRFWWGNLRDRVHWKDKDVDGRIILGWKFWNWKGFVGTGRSWLRIGRGVGRF
jgi:hypothetical protein